MEWEYVGIWLAGESPEDHLQEMLFPLQSLQRKLSMPKISMASACPFPQKSPQNAPRDMRGIIKGRRSIWNSGISEAKLTDARQQRDWQIVVEENPKGYRGFVLLFYGNEAFGIQGLEQAGMRLTQVRRSLC